MLNTESVGLEEISRRVFALPAEARQRMLQSLQDRGIAVQRLPIVAGDRPQKIPLSYAQQRQWFLWRLERTSGAYNIPIALRIHGALDQRLLSNAIASIVARHEVLRTRFNEEDGDAHQVISGSSELKLNCVELTDVPSDERVARAVELAQDEAAAPFDLERDHGLRVKLLRLAVDDHVLLATLHHVVSDDWSGDLLVREFAEFYMAALERRPAVLEPLVIQYADYSIWQRRWLECGEMDRQLDYWKRKLGSEHPVLQLPQDHATPRVRTNRGASFTFEIDITLTRRLARLASEQNATLFMLLLTAFKAILHRYSSQTEIRVGVPNANRNRVELERVMGFFVNTQVFSTSVDGKSSFLELLRRVRETTLDAQAHQDAPFEQVVEALNPERSLTHSPLFQVMFNHRSAMPSSSLELRGLTIEPFKISEQTTQMDLMLDTAEMREGIRATLTYSTELFEAPTIERLGQHLRILLERVVEEPSLPLAVIDTLTSDERAEVLGAARGPAPASGASQSYVELFEAAVARWGNREAARCWGQSVSYAELNRQSNRVGHALSRLGVVPDDVVAVVAERGLSLVAQMVGILKAGAAFLSLDPRYPEARLAECLEASCARVVLVTERTRHAVERALVGMTQRPRLVSFEDLEHSEPRADNVGVATGPRHLAYVIYTSGSTGKPKGVMVEQAGMLNNQLSKVPYLELGEGDVIAQTAAQSFDISIWQLLLGPLCGATVDIVSDEVAQDPVRLFRYVAERGITVLEMVPSLLELALSSDELPEERGLKLRWLLATGEGLPVRLAERWRERYPGVGLVNAYGPAECSDDVTLERVGVESLKTRGGQAAIGRPMLGTCVYVLDEHLGLVPGGVTGQLCVSGIGVGRGYLDDPARTAESFVPDPLSEAGGGRLYRTGDLGRQLAGGALEYVGRSDQQVKIRGQRIELGEIEARLQAHPGVKEAVVLAVGEQSQDKRLVAYVVLAPALATQEVAPVRQRLSEALAGELPDYMVPRQYVVLAQLPLNANGKLDRKSLPVPEATTSEAGAVAPQTELERELCEIWQEVLAVPRVGTTDNFFDLGGNSLLAVKVTSRVRAKLGVELELRAMFEVLTVKALAQRLESVVRPLASSDDLASIFDQLEGEEGLAKRKA